MYVEHHLLQSCGGGVQALKERVCLSRENGSGGLDENIIRMFSLGMLPNPTLNLNKMITN